MARFAGVRQTYDTARSTELWRTVVAVARSAHAHRTTGHAAEMAFFAVLTLVPSTIAVGAVLGLSKGVLGESAVVEAEDAAVGAVTTLMGPELADSVIAPFVHAQLVHASSGVAIGSLLIAWYLSGRLFESTGHALDAAYGVRTCRRTVVTRLLALAFALVSVALVAATIQMMVVGPLGDEDSGVAKWLGLGPAYTVVWSVVRWPLGLAIVVGFLVSLYRFAPNVHGHCWRECLPGAVLGAALWILAAVAFRLSAPLGLRASEGIAHEDPTVIIIGQSVNAVVSTVVWAYLASIAILLGGEFNAARRAKGEEAAAGAHSAPLRFTRSPDGAVAAADRPDVTQPTG
jgi:membrane protein